VTAFAPAQVTTVFLNVMLLLRAAGKTDNLLNKLNGVTLWLAFIVFRVVRRAAARRAGRAVRASPPDARGRSSGSPTTSPTAGTTRRPTTRARWAPSRGSRRAARRQACACRAAAQPRPPSAQVAWSLPVAVFLWALSCFWALKLTRGMMKLLKGGKGGKKN
jgi:hypothetical protein